MFLSVSLIGDLLKVVGVKETTVTIKSVDESGDELEPKILRLTESNSYSREIEIFR